MKFSQENLTAFFRASEASSFGEPVKTVERLAELIPSGGTVLDLGSGDGRNTLYLAEKGFHVKAVDLSEAAIEKLHRFAAQRGLAVETQIADAATYSVDRTYDAFVVVLLFQFLDEEATTRLLKEMKANTKSGGVHVVHLFTKSGDRQRLDLEEDPGSHCFYPDDGWLKEFYAGWEIFEYSSSTGPLLEKFDQEGSPLTSVVERIVARKP